MAAHNADSGYAANLYGPNPGRQGRDFLRCIGDVPNPGFGKAGGFRPEVASFFARPSCGMQPGEPKNALFLSLLPAHVPGRTIEPVPHRDQPPAATDLESAPSCRGLGPGSLAPVLLLARRRRRAR